ncbi:MAG: hypothetical protein HYV76_02805 [Candidatus Vogelbacteria bacterium]|nr:hypothetical protein [Candidatus Vogelbacteria bacterium]
MDTLAILFGSEARVKLLRLLLWHPDASFYAEQLADRFKLKSEIVRKELAVLVEAGVIRIKSKRGKRAWTLVPRFVLLSELTVLLAAEAGSRRREIIRRAKAAGKVRYLLVAGIFVNEQSRVDLLVVGEKLKKAVIEKLVADLELSLGRELNYAVLETEDYLFRLHSSDRFVRDIFDYPHLILIDKLPGA